MEENKRMQNLLSPALSTII